MHLSIHTRPPATLENAVRRLTRTLVPDDLIFINENEPEDEHHGLGLTIRNLWVHPPESKLRQHCIDTYGIGHPDDISALILKALWAYGRETEFDIAAAVQSYKDFWHKQGVDPITGELIASVGTSASWVKRFFGQWSK